MLLGDNTTEGRSYSGRSGSGVLGFGFQLDSFVYTYLFDHMYTLSRLAPDLPERNYRANGGVRVY